MSNENIEFSIREDLLLASGYAYDNVRPTLSSLHNQAATISGDKEKRRLMERVAISLLFSHAQYEDRMAHFKPKKLMNGEENLHHISEGDHNGLRIAFFSACAQDIQRSHLYRGLQEESLLDGVTEDMLITLGWIEKVAGKKITSAESNQLATEQAHKILELIDRTRQAAFYTPDPQIDALTAPSRKILSPAQRKEFLGVASTLRLNKPLENLCPA